MIIEDVERIAGREISKIEINDEPDQREGLRSTRVTLHVVYTHDSGKPEELGIVHLDRFDLREYHSFVDVFMEADLTPNCLNTIVDVLGTVEHDVGLVDAWANQYRGTQPVITTIACQEVAIEGSSNGFSEWLIDQAITYLAREVSEGLVILDTRADAHRDLAEVEGFNAVGEHTVGYNLTNS